jgi:hypothetical protein
VSLRDVVIRCAWRRLHAAEANLHLVPKLGQMHRLACLHLSALDQHSPLRAVLRVWQCAYYIERSAYHAAGAHACR